MEQRAGIRFADIFGDSENRLLLWILFAAFVLDFFLLLRLRKNSQVWSPAGSLIAACLPMIQGLICAIVACVFAGWNCTGLLHGLMHLGWSCVLFNLGAAWIFGILGMIWSMVLLGLVAFVFVGKKDRNEHVD